MFLDFQQPSLLGSFSAGLCPPAAPSEICGDRTCGGYVICRPVEIERWCHTSSSSAEDGLLLASASFRMLSARPTRRASSLWFGVGSHDRVHALPDPYSTLGVLLGSRAKFTRQLPDPNTASRVRHLWICGQWPVASGLDFGPRSPRPRWPVAGGDARKRTVRTVACGSWLVARGSWLSDSVDDSGTAVGVM